MSEKESNEADSESNLNKADDESNIKKEKKQDILYAKLFDYILNLQTINITDYDTILCGLLEENKEYLEKHSLKNPSGKLTDIPGMQWIIRGTHLGIREIKNRLNIASVIFETLKERFPQMKSEIDFQKCAIAAYLSTEFELEFSKTDDRAFDKLIKLHLLGNLNSQSAQKILSTNNSEYIEVVIELVKAGFISDNYKMYFYNYPKNSIIYSTDETKVQNAILYGTICEQFEQVSKYVVESGSDIVKKSLEKIRQLGLPLPHTVINNETLFLEALKYEYESVLDVFRGMSNNDAALDNNIKTIVKILNFDSDRKVYNDKIISDFCTEWENKFNEDHIFKLREILSEKFCEQILLFEKLFFGTHNVITTKEMSALSFENALILLNVKSSNFSVSHLRYIVNRLLKEDGVTEQISKKVCEILIFSCEVFQIKDIADCITDYMIMTGSIIEELEKNIWNLLKKKPINSEDDEGITYEKQNEIYQKYKQIINTVPVAELSNDILSHINEFHEFDGAYDYTLDVGKKLYDNGYFLMYTLVCLHNDSEVDFSDINIIQSKRENLEWFSDHSSVFLMIRKQIIKRSENLLDYLFCFSPDLPIISKEEFGLLISNKSIKTTDLLKFFPVDLITNDEVEYITRYLNKNHINNNSAYYILKSFLKYNENIIKQFFEKIDFTRSILYYTFSGSKKLGIKKMFEEILELDTNAGKLKFMELTKCLDTEFEKHLRGNMNNDMEIRYVNLIKQRKAPTKLSTTTIDILKTFSKYYAFGDYTGVNERLFEEEEYEYFVISTVLNAKKFLMLDEEKTELLWPTYIQIFTNPSRFAQTVEYMKANKDFLHKIMESGLYIGFSESVLETLALIKQDTKLVSHIFARGDSFAIRYFSILKSGFIDKVAAQKFIDLISLNKNLTVLKNDSVRGRVYDMLVDPGLKAKYTKLRKNCGCKY